MPSILIRWDTPATDLDAPTEREELHTLVQQVADRVAENRTFGTLDLSATTDPNRAGDWEWHAHQLLDLTTDQYDLLARLVAAHATRCTPGPGADPATVVEHERLEQLVQQLRAAGQG